MANEGRKGRIIEDGKRRRMGPGRRKGGWGIWAEMRGSWTKEEEQKKEGELKKLKKQEEMLDLNTGNSVVG